jgi:hypothetical protein
MKDTSKLTKKRITDRRGRSTTVWVKTGQADESKSGLMKKLYSQGYVSEISKNGKGEKTFSVELNKLEDVAGAIESVKLAYPGVKVMPNTVNKKQVMFVLPSATPKESTVHDAVKQSYNKKSGVEREKYVQGLKTMLENTKDMKPEDAHGRKLLADSRDAAERVIKEAEGKESKGGELTEKVDRQRALKQAKKDWTDATIATTPWNEDGSDKSAEEVAALEKKASELEKKFKKMERDYMKKYNLTSSPIQ